jgi:hypothetical protein
MRFRKLLSVMLCAIFLVTASVKSKQITPATVTIPVSGVEEGAVVPPKIQLTSNPYHSLCLKPNWPAQFTVPARLGGRERSIGASEIGISKSNLDVLADKNQLQLLGLPDHPSVALSLSQFAVLPHITVSVRNGHTDTQEVYSGVRLADLLSKIGAPIGNELRGKAMTSCVRASASDGYAVVFSLSEIDPEFHPGEIIVADQMNGQPLDAKSGPFRVVASEDKRPARWVRNLTTLQLRTVD